MAFKNNDSFELGCSLARIAGSIEGTARYDSEVSLKTKLRLLQLLIDEFTKLDPNSAWLQKWEEMKKEISK